MAAAAPLTYSDEPYVVITADTHAELVEQVRAWLDSAGSHDTAADVTGNGPDAHLSPAEAIEQGAELTKEALRVIAQAAPSPVAENEVHALMFEPASTRNTGNVVNRYTIEPANLERI